jgi:protein arginine N-methyltransferase 1
MYSLRDYGAMILDEGRTRPYVEALRRAVKPGGVVLDIGTGTGLFALLACRFGARQVFAVETSDAIEFARDIAAANGLSDRIQFIQAASTEIALPQKADVIVAEIHGVLPLFERSLVTLADARRRLLAPGGVMIPLRETLWAAPVTAPDDYRRLVAPWGDALGVDMSAARALITNDMFRAQFEPGQLLGEPVRCATLDYSRIETPDLHCEFTCAISRPGRAHGLAVWFDSTLMAGIEITNAPGKPKLIFGNAFFPWQQPLEASAGDRAHVVLRAKLLGDRYFWSWDSRIESSDGLTRALYRQSQLLGLPMSMAKVREVSARSHE